MVSIIPAHADFRRTIPIWGNIASNRGQRSWIFFGFGSGFNTRIASNGLTASGAHLRGVLHASGNPFGAAGLRRTPNGSWRNCARNLGQARNASGPTNSSMNPPEAREYPPSTRGRHARSRSATPPICTTGNGSVATTVARTLSCGMETPILRKNNEDHAPPARTTSGALIRPASVTTPLTRPAVISSARTAQFSMILAPTRAAIPAKAGTATHGSARISLGV